MTDQRRERRVRWGSLMGAVVVLLGLILFFIYGNDTRPQLSQAAGSTTTQAP